MSGPCTLHLDADAFAALLRAFEAVSADTMMMAGGTFAIESIDTERHEIVLRGGDRRALAHCVSARGRVRWEGQDRSMSRQRRRLRRHQAALRQYAAGLPGKDPVDPPL